jgi:ATP-binding cassette subfamily F protein 3
MPLLQAVNLRHAYGADIILDGANFTIEPGERVGLVGRNGAGKSTLVRALSGDLKPDAGEVSLAKGRRMGHLTQHHDLDPGETLRGAAEGAFADLHDIHRRLEEVYDRMGSAEGDELDRLMRQQVRLEEQMEAAGGYVVGHKIDATLHGLGFTDEQFGIHCHALSGGQRSRLALARLLLESPDLLLLDEPTNHLDITGRLWLENFLVHEFRGAVLMITHDRRMLDNTVTKILEVEGGRLIEYPGNYQKFRELRKERRIVMLRSWEKQQTKFRQQEEYIRKYKTGQRAKEARGRQTKLEREKRDNFLEKPLELDVFSFPIPKAPRPGDVLVSTRGLSKKYENRHPETGERLGERVLFHDLDVAIGRGERWGVIGPNGAGKTTLVKCMLGEMQADSGEVRLGTNLKIGYFRQIHDVADPDAQVYRYLQKLVATESPENILSEQQARDLAGAFLFSGEDQDKPMHVLSGGERARVLLASLIASGKNLLVLDEPTNHLDIPSAERLEEALSVDSGYEGALILISHDRALIDAACDRLLVLDGEGGCEVFLGNYTAWARKQAERAGAQQARQQAEKDAEERRRKDDAARKERDRAEQAKQKAPSNNALSRLRMDQLEERIEKTENRIKAIDRDLADPKVWSDPKRSKQLGDERTRLVAELEPLEFEWSRRAAEE